MVETERSMADECHNKPTNESANPVFIGKKPLTTYVTSALIQLSEFSTVSIRARGLSIGRAVDVSQVLSSKKCSGLSIGNITIGSESSESKNGKTKHVSTIDIRINKD